MSGITKIPISDLHSHRDRPQSRVGAFSFARHYYNVDPLIAALVDAETERLTKSFTVTRSDLLRSVTLDLVLLGEAHLYQSDQILLHLVPDQFDPTTRQVNFNIDGTRHQALLEPTKLVSVKVGECIFRHGERADGYARVGIPDFHWDSEYTQRAFNLMDS